MDPDPVPDTCDVVILPLLRRRWEGPLVLLHVLGRGEHPSDVGLMHDLVTPTNPGKKWDTSTRFSRNRVAGRCETRVGVAVQRPPHRIVSVDMRTAV